MLRVCYTLVHGEVLGQVKAGQGTLAACYNFQRRGGGVMTVGPYYSEISRCSRRLVSYQINPGRTLQSCTDPGFVRCGHIYSAHYS
jgi:hypothetical protein